MKQIDAYFIGAALAFGLLQGNANAANLEAAASPVKRALVLANSRYSVNALKNPQADASLMSNALRSTGFAVDQRSNLSREDLYSVTREFSESLPAGAIAFVYYAGHGMQIRGNNYLIPVDMVPTSEVGVASRAYSVSALVDKLKASKAGVSIVVLDACRNNPFLPQSPSATRSFSNLGLAKTISPRGMIIAYSTAPGQLAEDGAGRANSLYTETLAAEVQKTGLTIENVLKKVGDAVRRQTLDDQQPWFETSLVQDFYFLPPPGVQIVASKQSSRKRTETNPDNRSLGASSQWFSTMTENEWQKLDGEINRRVALMTADELPALEQRATKGSVVAQTTLGLLYRAGISKAETTPSSPGRFGTNGPTITRSLANNTKALRWLHKAADAGFPPAQVELGEMYYAGHGVDRDLGIARRWLESASQADYPRAKIDLAQLNAEQGGTPEDYMSLLKALGAAARR